MPHPHDPTISRRTLAKVLALGAAAVYSPLVSLAAEQTTVPTPPQRQSWRKVHPGIWRMRIGTPERFTPVLQPLHPSRR